MNSTNIYELLYMHHTGDQRACTMIEETVHVWMDRWIREKIRNNYPALRLYYQEMFQESLLGMYDAIENYRTDRNTGFVTFLKVVIDRRIQNFMRGIKPENNEISIDEEVHVKNNTYTLKDILEQKDGFSSPEYALSFQESREQLKDVVMQMKGTDRDVLIAYSKYDSYKDAADRLDMSVTVYGAKLRRAKLRMKEKFDRKRTRES